MEAGCSGGGGEGGAEGGEAVRLLYSRRLCRVSAVGSGNASGLAWLSYGPDGVEA